MYEYLSSAFERDPYLWYSHLFLPVALVHGTLRFTAQNLKVTATVAIRGKSFLEYEPNHLSNTRQVISRSRGKSSLAYEANHL